MIDTYDLELISPIALKAILRDECKHVRETERKNNGAAYARMVCWFDQFGGVPEGPTVIQEFDAHGNIIPVTYEDMRNHRKVIEYREETRLRNLFKEKAAA